MKFRARNLPRHSQFDYQPRFYDPDKERLARLAPDYEGDDSTKKMKEQISQSFSRRGRSASQFSFRTERSAQASTSNKRLLVIIMVIGALAYLVLSSNIEGILAALRAG